MLAFTRKTLDLLMGGLIVCIVLTYFVWFFGGRKRLVCVVQRYIYSIVLVYLIYAYVLVYVSMYRWFVEGEGGHRRLHVTTLYYYQLSAADPSLPFVLKLFPTVHHFFLGMARLFYCVWLVIKFKKFICFLFKWMSYWRASFYLIILYLIYSTYVY